MLKTKKSNLYYRGLFDRIEFISPSSATLPKSFKELLPEERIHSEYSDILVQDLIDDMYCGPNVNQLIVFDDCIKDINNSRTLSRVFQNRRHCTQKCDDPDDDEKEACHCDMRSNNGKVKTSNESEELTENEHE